jgi:hypothetical protein
MSLIIKNKIAQLKKGYPTVSDKYNVQGGIYVGESKDALHFGDLVFTSGTTGHYVTFEDAEEDAKLAGICLATNVKLANRYPGDSNAKVETLKGEAFNLLVRGFVAVAIADATTAYTTAKAAYELVIKDKTKTAEEKKQAKATFETAKAKAIASAAVEGAPVYLVDGELKTTGADDQELKDVYFMGVAEIIDDEVLAEINYKM